MVRHSGLGKTDIISALPNIKPWHLIWNNGLLFPESLGISDKFDDVVDFEPIIVQHDMSFVKWWPTVLVNMKGGLLSKLNWRSSVTELRN